MTIITKTVIASIVNDDNFNNPAAILKELNKNIQKTMKQDNPNSASDAGFDGGILYYNKKEKRIVYAGAKTPLFYLQNNELNTYKGDRQSIGYKKSNIDFEFSNFSLDIDKDTYIYITTDGYIDQNGGDDGYPLGKKKLQELIKKNYTKPFSKQKRDFTINLLEFQGDLERDDDVTFFACKITASESKNEFEYFYDFSGILTQDKLGEIEDKIVNKYSYIFEHTRKKEKLLTIFYELGQNIIKYAIQNRKINHALLPVIKIGHNSDDDTFYIVTRNLVEKDCMEKIKQRIDEANSINKTSISKIYKEYRKSNKYSHERGEGLGFFELAKRSSEKIRYNFREVGGKYYYSIGIKI